MKSKLGTTSYALYVAPITKINHIMNLTKPLKQRNLLNLVKMKMILGQMHLVLLTLIKIQTINNPEKMLKKIRNGVKCTWKVYALMEFLEEVAAIPIQKDATNTLDMGMINGEGVEGVESANTFTPDYVKTARN